MKGPFSNYADLGVGISDIRIWVPREEVVASLPAEDALARERQLGLERNEQSRPDQQLNGEHLVLPQFNQAGDVVGHRILRRSRLYSLCKPDELLACVRSHMDEIGKHGRGRVWFLLEPAHVVCDDGGDKYSMVDVDGSPHFVVRTLYGHEDQAMEP